MPDGTTYHISFNVIDYLFLAVVILSILFSFWRGFVREALTLLTWAGAIVFAALFCADFASYFLQSIHAMSLRLLTAFVLIFLLILIIGSILSKLLSNLVKKSGLGSTDRSIGVLFGLVRGLLVVAVIVMLANFSHFSESPTWKASALVPTFELMVNWLHQQVRDILSAFAR